MESLQQKKTPGMAIAALICGILGLIPPLSLIAVILGVVALNKINKDKDNLKGQGLAISGIVLGVVTIMLLPVISILAAIAIPQYLKAKTMAIESRVKASMYQIADAEDSYYLENSTYATLDELAEAGSEYISPDLASGYAYETTFMVVAQSDFFYATAFGHGKSKPFVFYIDEDKVLCRRTVYSPASIDTVEYTREGCPAGFKEVQEDAYY
ncbi:MAG: DUF4190 domain-containing protein [Candidatus Omnitrophica bacterium]|nr:DUF4190 domain-containing protein [Candidatus Omnitrophota bacterium]